jgi:hypothetical protein
LWDVALANASQLLDEAGKQMEEGPPENKAN